MGTVSVDSCLQRLTDAAEGIQMLNSIAAQCEKDSAFAKSLYKAMGFDPSVSRASDKSAAEHLAVVTERLRDYEQTLKAVIGSTEIEWPPVVH